jgi:SAM-dependent methyltransferase
VRSLEQARDRYLPEKVRLLDAGGGVMPYYPLFAERAIEYAGNDIEDGPGISYVSPLEELNAPSDHFDLVLCTQVLEHVRRPQQALEQITRVLVPGGYLFLTTHGVYPFHPDPRDYWRWTQQGFEAMFEDVAGLDLVELVPHNGSASTLTMLAAGGVRELAATAHVPLLGRPLIAALNILGLAGDRLLPRSARERLVGTFLAVAQRRS